jgi:hypothetical protein
VGKASSAKKVARASRAGGRSRVRRQSGLLFPVTLGVVVVLGLLLIVWARHDNQATAATPPVVGDHWHAAYGFYICGSFKPTLSKGSNPQEPDPLGIHTHADGVIHIHPFSSATTGRNATIGAFFDWLGVKMSNDKLELPEGQGTYANGDTCQKKPGKLMLAQWDDVQRTTADPKVFVTDFKSVQLGNGQGYTIAFMPDDFDPKKLPKPPAAAKLAELGATDTATAAPTATVAPTVKPTGATAKPPATTAKAAPTTAG